MTETQSHPDKLLRLPAVLQMTGFARTCLYRAISSPPGSDHRFPRPMKRGRVSLWPESEVLAWIERQKAQRNAA